MAAEQEHLADYAALTSEMQFEVVMTPCAGKCIVAKEALAEGVDVLEEVPLVAWPTPATAVGKRPSADQEAALVWKDATGRNIEDTPATVSSDSSATFCDACLCVFSSSSPHVRCEDARCGARFCSGACAESGLHRALCGSFGTLRHWQQHAALHSQIGIEALARINARIAERVLVFARCGLDPAAALLNALRPWERICAADAGGARAMGAPAEDIAATLRAHTAHGLAAFLETGMAAAEARAIADVLCSAAHVDGLVHRLLVNSFHWGHPTDRALRFGGLFMLASCCNHTCTPTAHICTHWTRAVEEGGAVGREAAEGEAAVEDDETRAAAAAEGGEAREWCSFTLRTMRAVAGGAELSLAYVDAELCVAERRVRLAHWGFECRCVRCEAETAAGAAAAGRGAQKRKAAGLTLAAPDEEALSQQLQEPPYPLVTRERPECFPAIAQRVAAAAARRTGDWRYSVLPDAVPRDEVLEWSRAFFDETLLLTQEGNTFGPDFEKMYTGHKNYYYHLNRNAVVPGSGGVAHIFERVDAYTRQAVELHHPGVRVRLDRAFGAYYEGGRAHFHLGCSEHCDGDNRLASTVVHATLPSGDVGFVSGGELTVSAARGLPAAPVTHSNASVGSIVYMGGAVSHLATPIEPGGRRLVFCMFYACDEGDDLAEHALV